MRNNPKGAAATRRRYCPSVAKPIFVIVWGRLSQRFYRTRHPALGTPFGAPLRTARKPNSCWLFPLVSVKSRAIYMPIIGNAWAFTCHLQLMGQTGRRNDCGRCCCPDETRRFASPATI
ncbi:hypothetical protein ACLKA7_010653 [Drosophila subpalustris]